MASIAPPTIDIRRALPADAGRLAVFAARAFTDTFGGDNTPENMVAYLDHAFGEMIQREELTDPSCTAIIAERERELVGYAMLRDGAAPAVVTSQSAIEIARLYADRSLIGTGVGARLMQTCLDEAAARSRAWIWLGVWERNPRAIAFYQRWGFREVGTQPFVLGTDEQTDLIMARRVEP